MGALGYGTRQAGRRLAQGRKPQTWSPSLRDTLLADPNVIALYDGSDPSTLHDASGTVADGSGAAAARLLDLKGQADFVQAAPDRQPITGTGLAFDGDDDVLEVQFATGSGPAEAELVCIYMGTDSVGCLWSTTGPANRFAGLWQAGATDGIHSGAGAPDFVIDGIPFAGNRGQLRTAIADGAAHVVELRKLSLTTWTGLALGTLKNLGGTFHTLGMLLPVVQIEGTNADLSKTRETAFDFAEDVIRKLGLTSA